MTSIKKRLESLQEGEPSHEKDNEKKQHWGKNNIKERANGNFKNEIYSGNQDITICSHDFSQEPNGHSSEVIDSKECNDDFYEFELLTDTRHCSNSLRKGDQKEVCVSVTEKGMSTTGIGICDTINYEQNPPKALNTSWDIIHDELDTPDDDRLSNCSKLTELIDEIFSENETDSEENPNQAACLNLEKESLHDFDSSRNLNQELNITSIAYKPMSNPSNYLPQSENFRNRQLGIGISSSNSGSERSLSTVTDFWSRGNALESRNGEKIQPVKIVLPEKRSNKRLSMSSSSESTPKSKKRIITVPHNQPKISSAICMKVTPKAITPYSVFIQENKEKILLENPDYNTDRINDVLLGKWKELTEKGREYYVKECMKLKYNNINVNDIDDSLEETEINYSTSLKSQKVEDVNFSIHDLKTSISKNNCKVQSGIKGKITLIGEKENLWFGLFENREIVLINILKLHQVTLYNNLCASFKLSLVVLRNSIPLEFLSNEKFISLGKVVRMLSAEEHGRLDPYKYIIDPRLTWNGFFVRHFETTDEFRAEIWQMSQTMPTYGVTDLIEILQHIEKDNNIELRESRPLKLLAYLQEEALRISKNMPKRVTHEHLQEMLSSFDETSHFISSQKNLDRSIVHRISVVS